MEVTELLTTDRVATDVEARDRDHVLELLSGMLATGAAGLEPATVFDALIGRERLGSTAIGHGVAMPHGRVDGVRAPVGALLRLAKPVDFEATDGMAVDLVFGVLVPPECDDEHLAALAAVATVFNDAGLRDGLRAAAGPGAVLALLTGG